MLASAPVQTIVIHRTLAYPFQRRPLQLQLLTPGTARTRTLRGALCGGLAAAVWALAQPLDKLLFASPYDDVELLGKAVTRGDAWYAAGLALHVQNGALFGAAYSNLAPLVPIAPPLRGPALALAQGFVFWPLGALSDRFHPARKQIPAFAGNRRALAQSTWRHLVFGIVLGELERRLNATSDPLGPEPKPDFSSNGHGNIEHAATAGPAS